MSRAPALAALSLAALVLAGAAAPDDGYELVRGPAPAGMRRGDKATVSLSLVPRAGHHLLQSGPVLVRLRGDGVRPVRALYRRDDAVDPRADVPRFELGFVAEREGRARLAGDCTFYVCKADRCRPVETHVDWTVDVAP
ncbi:MAG TPA: hypothetical protein VFF06_13415 [Polyangia bacterium]|nr:hypothetical protein [Polyangia bacterium]